MTDAPLFTDIADAPEGGQAHWATCSDGVRIRVATWKSGTKGTVLIFPGRTEYIEKYGRAVQSCVDRGYSVAVIDWRGQGLSDRLTADHQLGHVQHFLDYQLDIDAMLDVVRNSKLPEVYALISHSMGGTIALRALHNGMTVKKAIFSAPMWGIHIPPLLRIPAFVISNIGPFIGLAQKYAPNTNSKNYVQVTSFADNTLTNNKETYHWLVNQMNTHPELGIGGPSIGWLHQALVECAELRRMTPPDYNCLCFLGSQEAIVSPPAIKQLMGRWKNGNLVKMAGSQHEMMMEKPPVLKQFWDETDRFLAT